MIQNQVLNFLLNTKDSSLIILNNLDKRYFSEYPNEWLFIDNHFKQYGNIPDKETFISHFPDFELVNVEESPSYLISELFKDYQKKQLVKAFNNVAQNLNDGSLDKALDEFKYSYDNISRAGISLQCVDILKDTSRYDDYVERTKDHDKYFIKTGFKELDDIIGGWDREEELATIIARPGVGKSWLLIKFALAAVEQGLKVGLYSGEMSEKKVGYRFDTLVQHVANGSLVHGNVDAKIDYTNYINDLSERFEGSLKVLTPAMINGPAGVRVLRAFIEKEKLDILFIDQHSLLEDDNHAKNPVEKAANISKDLKNLQVVKKIPIIAVSQMNRTKNDDGSDLINLTQISQADRIGQDSTCVIGIDRDKKDRDLMRLHLVKLRDNGEVGKCLSYITNLNLGKFIFVPEEEKTKSETTENEKYESQDVNEEEF